MESMPRVRFFGFVRVVVVAGARLGRFGMRLSRVRVPCNPFFFFLHGHKIVVNPVGLRFLFLFLLAE
jgi:hypothetical protein